MVYLWGFGGCVLVSAPSCILLTGVIPVPAFARTGSSWNPGLIHWKVFAIMFHIFFNIPSKQLMECNLA